MVNLRGCRPIFSADDFAGVRDLVPKLVRPRKRLTELLVKTVEDPPSKKQTELWKDAEKSWTLKLLRTPEEIIGDQVNIDPFLGNSLTSGSPTFPY